ncbi:MAG: hypothetical protein GAK28_02199 [Luteibacter sp.]|uniref:hypothetical protein n=1 Tax=Luteibacter sp. TaxID=1886636 RepID=UPI00137FF32B|nr:hypothetical protein [Luteibacter sp.]KAF1006880.1 MAG: hypothetical protein GAK28_02199 [Luteibacter sp.]
MKLGKLAWALSLAVCGVASAGTVMPTRYGAGHFFLTPTLASGEHLDMVVDTGGGGSGLVIWETEARRLGLKAATCPGFDGGMVEPPVFAKDSVLPSVARGCGKFGVSPGGVMTPMTGGQVSGWYLSAHTWTFDYPAHRLVLEASDWKPDAAAEALPIGLVMNAKGEIGIPYPRITLDVAGERIDLLLDTGATAHPSPAGGKAMGTEVDEHGFAGGSYIITRVMDRWHKAHPDWPLVDGADDLGGAGKATRAIRVPYVQVGRWRTGPVWFTERPDKNFLDKGMSSIMDETVYGAAGGNIYAPFRMTVDYAHRKVWFTRVGEDTPGS